MAAEVHAIAERLGISLSVVETDLGVLAQARSSRFCGWARGATAEQASVRALMECVERQAQFGQVRPPISRVAAFSEIADLAICPRELGLYAAGQYRAPGFVCAPFSADEIIEWIEGRDLVTGAATLVPVEFVHPHARLDRRPLVHETSSGTAAHEHAEAATLAALCEVIERDACMIFWYRQPPTATLQLRALPSSAEQRTLQALGYVITICCLDNELGVPCFLALALRGREFAYGLGCHPNGVSALEHATRELLACVVWSRDAGPSAHGSHYPLYHCGPFHEALRELLARTLLRPVERHPWLDMNDATLETVLDRLSARGLRAIAFDLRAPELAGIHVRRVLVPGLVPIHFGAERMRLGCARLVGREAPGRLSTLLPHFMH